MQELDDDDFDNDDNKMQLKTKSEQQQPLKVDELLKAKKERFYKPFSDEVLVSDRGLSKIYNQFPKNYQFRGSGYEELDLRNLINGYKEWAFQLHPSLACDDVLSKCESLGSKSKVRCFVNNLREKERDRYLEEVMGIKKLKKSSVASEYESDENDLNFLNQLEEEEDKLEGHDRNHEDEN